MQKQLNIENEKKRNFGSRHTYMRHTFMVLNDQKSSPNPYLENWFIK